MDAAFDIARNAVNLRYEDIPGDIVDLTRQSILDTLGVIAAASTMGEASKEIVKLVKESGAKGNSTIIGHNARVPSWLAGFANGSMVHEMDYDDLGVGVHPSACAVPAAFAVAEEIGKINGREFITAIAMAVDLSCRMGLAISGSRTNLAMGRSGWMSPPLLGFFTATVAAGRILGLSEDEMQDALGHTLEQAAGSSQWQHSPGSVFRGIRDGFSNKGGILSALMAKRGLPGTRDSLEGKAGFFNLYYRGEYERSFLVDELGKRFENRNVGFKPWPVCGIPLPSVDATLGLLSRHDIKSKNIKTINVLMAELTGPFLAQVENLEERRRPETVIDAKFSIPFAVGIAAARRNVVIKDFTKEGLKDQKVLEMAGKITVMADPQVGNTPYNLVVEIETKDGKRYSNGVDVPYGNPKKPIASEDLIAKFKDCVSYSARPLSGDNVEAIIEMMGKLEEVEDVSSIIRMLG
ncbi:MmgE/PrpD family protein [Thermodesulfobacteriota bacterium]